MGGEAKQLSQVQVQVVFWFFFFLKRLDSHPFKQSEQEEILTNSPADNPETEAGFSYGFLRLYGKDV